MVKASADAIGEVVARTQEAMAEASEIILGGFRLRSDANIVRWPDRYMYGRGRDFWGRLMALLPAESDSPRIRRRDRPIPGTFDEETGELGAMSNGPGRSDEPGKSAKFHLPHSWRPWGRSDPVRLSTRQVPCFEGHLRLAR